MIRSSIAAASGRPGAPEGADRRGVRERRDRRVVESRDVVHAGAIMLRRADRERPAEAGVGAAVADDPAAQPGDPAVVGRARARRTAPGRGRASTSIASDRVSAQDTGRPSAAGRGDQRRRARRAGRPCRRRRRRRAGRPRGPAAGRGRSCGRATTVRRAASGWPCAPSGRSRLVRAAGRDEHRVALHRRDREPLVLDPRPDDVGGAGERVVARRGSRWPPATLPADVVELQRGAGRERAPPCRPPPGAGRSRRRPARPRRPPAPWSRRRRPRRPRRRSGPCRRPAAAARSSGLVGKNGKPGFRSRSAAV